MIARVGGDVVAADRRRRTRSVFEALGMTSKRSSSTHHTMMSSSTEASSASSRWVYWARPGAILPRSLVSAACSRSRASGPVDPHGAEVADVEGDGAGAAGPVLGERARRVLEAACPSRRRGPSWPRGRGGRRRAARCCSVTRRTLLARPGRPRLGAPCDRAGGAAGAVVTTGHGLGEQLDDGGVDLLLHTARASRLSTPWPWYRLTTSISSSFSRTSTALLPAIPGWRTTRPRRAARAGTRTPRGRSRA